MQLSEEVTYSPKPLLPMKFLSVWTFFITILVQQDQFQCEEMLEEFYTWWQISCYKNTHSINCVLSFHHPLDLQVAYHLAWGGKLAIPQCQIHQSFDDFDNCHIEIIVTWRIFFFWHLIFLITTIYFPKIVCTFYYYYIHIVTIFNMYFYFLLHTQPMVYTIYFNYRCSLGIKICFRRRHISNACTSYRDITDKYFIFINH